MEEEDRVMYCSNCGQQMQGKALFCTKCGFKLNGSVEDTKSYFVELCYRYNNFTLRTNNKKITSYARKVLDSYHSNPSQIRANEFTTDVFEISYSGGVFFNSNIAKLAYADMKDYALGKGLTQSGSESIEYFRDSVAGYRITFVWRE